MVQYNYYRIILGHFVLEDLPLEFHCQIFRLIVNICWILANYFEVMLSLRMFMQLGINILFGTVSYAMYLPMVSSHLLLLWSCNTTDLGGYY